MEFKQFIKKRRSIRKFKDKEVSNDLIEQLIDAARFAPSGMNTQPWSFIGFISIYFYSVYSYAQGWLFWLLTIFNPLTINTFVKLWTGRKDLVGFYEYAVTTFRVAKMEKREERERLEKEEKGA